MKHTAQLVLMAGALFFSVLPGCRTIPLDEHAGSRLLVGPVSLADPTPTAELLVHLLNSCRSLQPGVPIDLEILVRDRRVGPKPETKRLLEEQITSGLDWGKTTFQCRRISLENALELLVACVGLDFHISPWAHKGRVLVEIGPPELVRDHPRVTRRTYRIPNEHSKAFASLPPLLSPGGITLAYDPEHRMLTVIDNACESTAEWIVTTIGAERIDEASHLPEL